MEPATVATLLAVGAAAGFVGALFGVGGGIVMVPVLHYALGVEWHQATAVSLLAIALMTPWGVLQHARRGAVAWSLAGWVAVGGLAGTLLGQWLEPRVGVPLLKVLFAVVMLVAAYRLVAAPPRTHDGHPRPAWLVLLGVGAGIVSKLLGVGGGILVVPALAFLGTPIHVAVGSSLVAVFSNGAFASAAKLAQGASLWWGVPLAIGGLAAIPLGARVAHALPSPRLRQVCAGGLAAVAIYVGATSGAL